MSFPTIRPAEVHRRFLNREETALLDLREEDPYAQEHPLWAANLPLALIEQHAPVRIPRKNTLLVLYGDAGEAETGAKHFAALGYSDVRLLEGGLAGWKAAGHEVFRDVNVPSKAFGEWLEAERHTPSLPAEEVHALLEQHAAGRADVVVLDARRFDEYQTMSIPGAISVPGAELVLRVRELAPRPTTQVIVNCAGRTRSLVGAQSLVNAGIPNPVAALRNGTIGWLLAGLELDHGASRRGADAGLTPQTLAAAQADARRVAERAGVQRISLAALAELDEGGKRTVYRFDVRTPEEYAAGHLPGFVSTPGGQLVQETDHHAPVRGARIVLDNDDDVRALMTASWLAQMGWEVSVLDGVQTAERSALGAATMLPKSTRRYRRPYEGTSAPREAMQAYLDWEFGLVAQLARDGTHNFKVV